MSNNLFKQYQNAAEKAGIKRNTKESIEWFRELIRKRSSVKHAQVTEGKRSQRLQAGQLVTYLYSAKTKDKLPYWDRQPLIIILSFTDTGWYGANLHYLPPKLRAALLSELSIGKKSMPQIVAALENNKLTAPCLKRYLISNCQSKPVQIPKDEWEIAIQLPFESWVGSNSNNIWKDSRNKV